jgi:hypothetical protein
MRGLDVGRELTRVTPPSFAISWIRIWSSDDDDDSLCCVNDELMALLLVIAIHGRQSMLALASKQCGSDCIDTSNRGTSNRSTDYGASMLNNE